MRKKFRFYSKETNKYVNQEDYVISGDGLIYYLPDAQYSDNFNKLNDHIISEQCTGLKDHSKVDIFESDILKCSRDRFYGVVVFYYGKYLVDVYIEDRCVCRKVVTEYLASRRRASNEPCLVIGNINQNPELLK